MPIHIQAKFRRVVVFVNGKTLRFCRGTVELFVVYSSHVELAATLGIFSLV